MMLGNMERQVVKISSYDCGGRLYVIDFIAGFCQHEIAYKQYFKKGKKMCDQKNYESCRQLKMDLFV